MMIIEGTLVNKSYYMGGPGFSIALMLYYDDKNPIEIEEFDDGTIYERFTELDGNAINTELRIKATDLQQYIKDYVEAYDLYFMLADGSKQAQLELEIWK